MSARQNGESEDNRVEGGQVISRPVRDAGRKNDDCDGDNLDRCIELSQPRGPKSSEAGHDVDCCGADHDKDIATDNRHGNPERHWQVARKGLRKDAAHRQDNKCGNEHQLVGNWIQDCPELWPLIEASGKQTIKPIGDSRENKGRERKREPLIEEKGYEYGDQYHPKDGQKVRDSNDPGWRQDGDNQEESGFVSSLRLPRGRILLGAAQLQ